MHMNSCVVKDYIPERGIDKQPMVQVLFIETSDGCISVMMKREFMYRKNVNELHNR